MSLEIKDLRVVFLALYECSNQLSVVVLPFAQYTLAVISNQGNHLQNVCVFAYLQNICAYVPISELHLIHLGELTPSLPLNNDII